MHRYFATTAEVVKDTVSILLPQLADAVGDLLAGAEASEQPPPDEPPPDEPRPGGV